jgi:hypothetical protein
MMRLLAQRVPLTLLLDLLAPPNAEELYATEGGARLDWVWSHPPKAGE